MAYHPDDMYFKERPKLIIPDDNRDNDITPIVLLVINFSIFVTIGLLLYGYFYFKQ